MSDFPPSTGCAYVIRRASLSVKGLAAHEPHRIQASLSETRSSGCASLGEESKTCLVPLNACMC